jgi:hypothetical protein
MRITRTLAAALTIAALGASTAQAQPMDMHTSTAIAAAKAQHKQDLRSADARDAIRNPRSFSAASRRLPGPPTWPTRIAPIAHATSADPDPAVDWTSIAIGSAIGLLALGGLAGLASLRIRRLHRPHTVA